MRVSATTIEAFRLFITQDWMKESELLERITRTAPPPPVHVDAGEAFGKALERPGHYFDGDRARYEVDVNGTRFVMTGSTMVDPLRYTDHVRGVFEAKFERAYGPVNVVSKADEMIGAHLLEFKTTQDNALDFDRYHDSLQWRFMADASGATRITYVVFHIEIHDAVTDIYGKTVTEIECHSIDTMDLFPYPGLRSDCAYWASEFESYARRRGLVPLLEQKQREAEEGALC